MRHRSNIPVAARSLFLISVILVTGAVLLAAYVRTQQPTQERPVWDVQLARNAQASSNITIQNQCKQAHTFTVTEQQTPYIQLLGASTVNVPGKSSYNLPVRFNTNEMNAGQYQGNVVVKCETCGKEKTCTQDKEILQVRLTVLQDNISPITPRNPTPPQVPGPPVIGGPPGNIVATASAKIKDGWDADSQKEVDVSGREARADLKLCETEACGKIQVIPAGQKDAGNIYCAQVQKCGGAACPKAGCHMLVAWVSAEKYKKKNPNGTDEHSEQWTTVYQGGMGERGAFKPDEGKVYACGCH